MVFEFLDYFDGLYRTESSVKEPVYVFNYPLLWFVEELPTLLRFLLAAVVISFMVYKSMKIAKLPNNGHFFLFKPQQQVEPEKPPRSLRVDTDEDD